MRTHELKCWPAYFKALQSGEKTFEMRRNDRDYKVGDGLWLNEWNPTTESYTDQLPLRFTVTYIMHGQQFGLEPGWCCMSITPITGTAPAQALLTKEQPTDETEDERAMAVYVQDLRIRAQQAEADCERLHAENEALRKVNQPVSPEPNQDYDH